MKYLSFLYELRALRYQKKLEYDQLYNKEVEEICLFLKRKMRETIKNYPSKDIRKMRTFNCENIAKQQDEYISLYDELKNSTEMYTVEQFKDAVKWMRRHGIKTKIFKSDRGEVLISFKI